MECLYHKFSIGNYHNGTVNQKLTKGTFDAVLRVLLTLVEVLMTRMIILPPSPWQLLWIISEIQAQRSLLVSVNCNHAILWTILHTLYSMRALVKPSLRPCFRCRTLLPHRWTHRMADRQAIEEQTLPFYDQKQYYPVQPGEMLKDRYCTIAKLGYGAYSTVWLVWDEKFLVHVSPPILFLCYWLACRAREYASLKVCVQTEENESSPVLNEINMLHRLEKFAEKDHPGLDFTRLARDIFEIDGPSGSHYCIAFKPQGNSVRTLQETFPNAQLRKHLVKSIIHRLFFAVNWLHATCSVAHTGMLNVLTGRSKCLDWFQ